MGAAGLREENARPTLTTKRATYTVLDIEREICRRSLPAFLGHVLIPDPPPAGSGVSRFIQWPHLMRLHEAAEATAPGGVLPTLKARKLGVTSYFEARFVHKAQFQPGAMLPVVSQGEKEAQKVIADCKFIWERLPDHLRADLIADNLEMLKFKGGGTIQAFPATAKAGRSYTGTEILFDEADFHETFEASYNALLPLIQDTGGKLFAVSTANPDLVDSPFRQLYRRSPNRLFLGYMERPGRTEQGYGASRLLAGNDARFEKENPLTEAEALAPPKIRAYFDSDILGEMLEECREPQMTHGGLLRVWRPPLLAGKYIGFGDVSWGHQSAYSCFAIANWQTGVQVAEIYGRPDHDEYAQAIADLTTKYNKAYFSIEANGETVERSGLNVINKLIALGVGERMYHHGDKWRDEERQRGWLTTGVTRPVMLDKLETAIRKNAIAPMCRDAVTEMLTFIRNDKGRAEAAQGAYSDHVMAFAGLMEMWEKARFSSGKRVAVPSSW